MYKILFFVIVIFFGVQNHAQTIVIPQKLQSERGNEDFQLKAFLKFSLEKRGFDVLNADDLDAEKRNKPCDYYYTDVLEDNKFMLTRLRIVIYDCQRHEIVTSTFGVSKEKEYKKAYQLAFREAEKTLVINENVLSKNTNSAETITVEKQISANAEVLNTNTQNSEWLYAQPIVKGYQVVNSKPEVVFKIFNTSKINHFIVSKNNLNGIGYLEEDKLIIEYYIDNQLIKEIHQVKF